MDGLGISHGEDIRCMFDDLEVLALKKRSGVAIPPATLILANAAISSIVHVNKRAVHAKMTDYIESWIKTLRFMGKKVAENTLKLYENFNGPTPNPEAILIEKTPMNVALLKSIKMYKAMVLDLTPAISRMNVTNDPDPYIILKRMVEKVTADPTWINRVNVVASFIALRGRGWWKVWTTA